MEQGPHQPNDNERTPHPGKSATADTDHQHAAAEEPENAEVRAAYERYLAARANRAANLAPGVNSYGTDDPAEQARIETARTDAANERRRNRVRLERMVELGTPPDDAEAVIEFQQSVRDQRTPWNPDEQVGDIYQVDVGPDGVERVQGLPRTPRIYVADVASHRSGIQHGLWIDADQEPDELQADITAMLEASPPSGLRSGPSTLRETSAAWTSTATATSRSCLAWGAVSPNMARPSLCGWSSQVRTTETC